MKNHLVFFFFLFLPWVQGRPFLPLAPRSHLVRPPLAHLVLPPLCPYAASCSHCQLIVFMSVNYSQNAAIQRRPQLEPSSGPVQSVMVHDDDKKKCVSVPC